MDGHPRRSTSLPHHRQAPEPVGARLWPSSSPAIRHVARRRYSAGAAAPVRMGARTSLQSVGEVLKNLLHRVSFGLKVRLPLLLQTEATECGLACIGMVAGFHGHNTDLGTLRRRFPVSLKGVTLAMLIQVANRLGLVTRPLKLDVRHLPQLRLPCVLHWEFNHFVVLKEVRAN